MEPFKGSVSAMPSDQPPLSKIRPYKDPAFKTLEKKLDAMAEAGAGPDERARFIVDAFTERNRTIRNLDFKALDPSTVAKDYLLPRRDLYNFALSSWARHVFLPSLPPKIRKNLLMFGLGRIFSTYNDAGVQHSTDADFNIVVKDTVTAAERARIERELHAMKDAAHLHFQVPVEIDPKFTVLREKDVAARIAHQDAKVRGPSILFYKTNAGSIQVIKDEESIRRSVFERVRALPDFLLFENFLGFGSPKTSFMKLYAGVEALPILTDGGCDRLHVDTVLGSKPFALASRWIEARGPFVSPVEWHFSMKYYVNRVYDYVGAMRNLGHDLERIGFTEAGGKDKTDPDYAFLVSAHRLMLYLQELVQIVMRSYGDECDASYISRARFLRFSEIDGDKFRRDFEGLALGLLDPGDRARFSLIRRKIGERARDRIVTGPLDVIKAFPKGFRYELLFRDKHSFKVCVPYGWDDLGYFTFKSIAARMVRIVATKLLPALAGHGMPAAELKRYARAFGEARHD